MTFHSATLQFAAEPDSPGYEWPAVPLETFLRQNAAREDPAFTQVILAAYDAWRAAPENGAVLAHTVASMGPLEFSPEMDKPSRRAANASPFDAFAHVADATMRAFVRLLPHRISFATATVLTGMERAELESLTISLRSWLATTQSQHDLQSHIQLGFDPLASELTCPHCASSKAPVFFGLSWHHIQVYRCDACSQLFEAHQGLSGRANSTRDTDGLSHSHR